MGRLAGVAHVETFVVEGHIVDSLILAKVLDLILDGGADDGLVEVDIGKTSTDTSRAVIEITATDEATIGRLAEPLQVHGVNPVAVEDAELVAADQDGVLPAGFYSTTNLPAEVRLDGHWITVENPEMDCGLLVDGNTTSTGPAVRTIPMHRVRTGDRIVVGNQGVRVQDDLFAHVNGKWLDNYEMPADRVEVLGPQTHIAHVAPMRGAHVLGWIGDAPAHQLNQEFALAPPLGRKVGLREERRQQ